MFAELPPPTFDPDDARRAADEILARGEFEQRRSLLERIVDWIADRLPDWPFDEAGPSGASGDGGGVGAVGWLVFAVLLGAAVYLVLRYARFGARRRRRRGDSTGSVDIEERRTARQWFDEAARLEAAGQWKAGLRCRYRSLVAALVAAGQLADVAGRTTGEYRAELAELRPDLATSFAEATELFERAWYGDLPTGPTERDRFAARAASVLDGIDRLERAA